MASPHPQPSSLAPAIAALAATALFGPLSQPLLVEQIGTIPDVLNRALHSLSAAGLIVVERRQIRVIDVAGLEARAQLS